MKQDGKHALKPKLRFPEFGDAAWIAEPLRDFASLTTERAGNGKCVLMSITSGVGLVSQMEKFGRTIAGKQFTNYFTLRKNEFAYNKSATKSYPQGFIAMYSGDELAAVPNSIFTCFSVQTERVVPKYLNYLFLGNLHGRWLKKFIEVSARAHGSLSIDDDDLFSLPIPLPSGELAQTEQQKIADCLSSVDELIAAQARKVDALKTHKKGLMQQLFPREGETQPRLRFPEFQNAPEWEKKTLGGAATFYNGRAYKQEELLERGKYKVLRVGNFFTNNAWYYSDLELDETKYCDNGDLLYAWSASFGPRVWTGDKTIYHYHIWKVVEGADIDKRFLLITLENETAEMKAQSANGLGILHITKGTIENWESSFPVKAEQQRIADCLNSLNDLITAATQKLEVFKTHKKGLMQQLFPSVEEIES